MILLLSDDLMDASKTIGHARALGLPIVQCRSATAAIGQIESQEIACCIVDLHLPGLNLDELIAAISRLPRKARLIAYGSHVDAQRLSAARKAGCDEVMPRSKYFEDLGQIISSGGISEGSV
jgi:DNA-binding NarL/FixJ family response regulator